MGQLFVLCTNCLKYKNNLLSTKHHTFFFLFNTLKCWTTVLCCSILYCHILFCPIFFFLPIKRYLVKNIGATFRSWWELNHQIVLLQIPTQSIGTGLSKIAVAIFNIAENGDQIRLMQSISRLCCNHIDIKTLLWLKW
jgi:hypothetical protein